MSYVQLAARDRRPVCQYDLPGPELAEVGVVYRRYCCDDLICLDKGTLS
jgi:hypothetical protein